MNIQVGLRGLGLAAVCGAALWMSACGDETGSGAAGGTSSSSSSTSSGSGSGGAGGSAQGSGGAGGGGGQGGGTAACDMIPPGPFQPTLVFDVFDGSEDFAFNGKGKIAAKNKTNVILVDSMGVATTHAMNVPTAYGLRYRPDGYLVVALPNDGKVIQISPIQGTVDDYVTGLNGANGLYPDFDGNVWMTEIGAGRVSRINVDKSVDIIVQGPNAAGANGVVYDANRKILFYTNFGQGRIRSVDMSAGGDPTPKEVITIANSKLDGLLMDACGHLYVVDQGNSRLYRIYLDAAGTAMGPEELLAEFPKNVANAQFGSGSGFDPMTIYATGNPGSLYAISVGVPGAPVPTPN